MGSNKLCFPIWLITICLSIPISAVLIHDLHDPVALDSYLHNYTHSSFSNPRTGVLQKINLPANFSAIEISIVRLRSSQFWAKGAQFNPHFNIPPRIKTFPYVKRVEIMYENLGNLSSHYHSLPGYTFLAPVIGFTVYNASFNRENSNTMLNLKLLGEPITINFTNIVMEKIKEVNRKAKCVRFWPDRRAELSEMGSEYVCSSRQQGHFTIVAPETRALSHSRKREIGIWKWWVIGFGGGLVAILLIGVLGISVRQMWLLRRLRWMENKAGKSEALSRRWIGESRLPIAHNTRTQAILENEYDP